MKNKEILKALKELNLNNRGCEPTAKLTTNVTTLKGLNQYSGKILFSTPFPYRFCDSKSSYLFNPFGAAAAIVLFAVGFHPRLLKYHPFQGSFLLNEFFG
jgi:hypothetical protein